METLSHFILREILATSCFIMAIIFSLLSITKEGREHYLRVCALFLLGLVVLFANSPASYFASVFIIATAVTKLEFLQNLAAIIRGSKEYFEYQKETQSQKDVKSKIEKEILEEEVAVSHETDDSNASVGSTNVKFDLSADKLNYQSFALVTYEFALNMLEKQYGAVDRYPRFIGKQGRPIEFDGILETTNNLLIFEIKTSLRQVMPIKMLAQHLERTIENATELGRHKHKKTEVKLVYVVLEEFIEKGQERLKQLENNFSKEHLENVFSFKIISYKELGLDILAEEMILKRTNKPDIIK